MHVFELTSAALLKVLSSHGEELERIQRISSERNAQGIVRKLFSGFLSESDIGEILSAASLLKIEPGMILRAGESQSEESLYLFCSGKICIVDPESDNHVLVQLDVSSFFGSLSGAQAEPIVYDYSVLVQEASYVLVFSSSVLSPKFQNLLKRESKTLADFVQMSKAMLEDKTAVLAQMLGVNEHSPAQMEQFLQSKWSALFDLMQQDVMQDPHTKSMAFDLLLRLQRKLFEL